MLPARTLAAARPARGRRPRAGRAAAEQPGRPATAGRGAQPCAAAPAGRPPSAPAAARTAWPAPLLAAPGCAPARAVPQVSYVVLHTLSAYRHSAECAETASDAITRQRGCTGIAPPVRNSANALLKVLQLWYMRLRGSKLDIVNAGALQPGCAGGMVPAAWAAAAARQQHAGLE